MEKRKGLAVTGDRVSGPGTLRPHVRMGGIGTHLARVVKVCRGRRGAEFEFEHASESMPHLRFLSAVASIPSCHRYVATVRFDSIIFFKYFSLYSPLLLCVQRNTLSPGIFNTVDHSLVGTLLVFKSLFS